MQALTSGPSPDSDCCEPLAGTTARSRTVGPVLTHSSHYEATHGDDTLPAGWRHPAQVDAVLPGLRPSEPSGRRLADRQDRRWNPVAVSRLRDGRHRPPRETLQGERLPRPPVPPGTSPPAGGGPAVGRVPALRRRRLLSPRQREGNDRAAGAAVLDAKLAGDE